MVNGISRGNQPNDLNGNINGDTSSVSVSIILGNGNIEGMGSFTGTIKKFRIWNRVLTTREISDLNTGK